MSISLATSLIKQSKSNEKLLLQKEYKKIRGYEMFFGKVLQSVLRYFLSLYISLRILNL